MISSSLVSRRMLDLLVPRLSRVCLLFYGTVCAPSTMVAYRFTEFQIVRQEKGHE